MFVLVIILNKVDYLDDILAALAELKVSGATIIDSRGMAQVIKSSQANFFPIFESLRSTFANAQPFNNTIFTVLESFEKLQSVVSSLQKVMQAEKRPGAGFMFALPVAYTYNLGKI
jgi:nitrogen regulatory protein PII